MQTLRRAFKNTGQQIEYDLLVNAVLVSPYEVGSHYTGNEREARVALLKYLLKHALNDLVYEDE